MNKKVPSRQIFWALAFVLLYAAQSVACDVTGQTMATITVAQPQSLNAALAEHGCGEFLIRASLSDATAVAGPVDIDNMDVVISGGWSFASLVRGTPAQTPQRSTIRNLGEGGLLITADRNGPRRQVVLENLLIEGDLGSGPSASGGGTGIVVSGPVDLFVRNVVIRGNSAVRGGGIYLSNGAVLRPFNADTQGVSELGYVDASQAIALGSPQAAPLLVEDNRAELGGGLYCAEGGAVALDSGLVLRGNTAGKSGGGAYLDSCAQFDVHQLKLVGNRAEAHSGGGLFASDLGAFTLSASEILNNVARQDGGGMVISNSTLVLVDSQVSDNYSELDTGGGIYCQTTSGAMSELVLLNASLQGNRAANGSAVSMVNCELLETGSVLTAKR